MNIGNEEVPESFNNPFRYIPHPLCRRAAEEVVAYIRQMPEAEEEVKQGKMLGVMIVKDKDGIGFLAAYSGQIEALENTEEREWFVPAVFDYLQPDGYFKTHEREISDINARIKQAEEDKQYSSLCDDLKAMQERHYTEIAEYKRLCDDAKEKRAAKRAQGAMTAEERDAMTRESQFMKAELKRKKKKAAEEEQSLIDRLLPQKTLIEKLKAERHQKSDALQEWLFRNFVMLNAKGERSDLIDIFSRYGSKATNMRPPSGSGECCAPKLLQYAFLHHLKPLQIAEFWYGASPKKEIRHQGEYYPACSGKCKPILTFMMQGMKTEFAFSTEDDTCENIWDDSVCIQAQGEENGTIEILYDDPHLSVICKPAGMLAEPGKIKSVSAKEIYQRIFPSATGPVIVHRLDMDTSGVMIMTKDLPTYWAIQKQFERRTIHKRYIALVEGQLSSNTGNAKNTKKASAAKGLSILLKFMPDASARNRISLPLRPDILDRPRQIVDFDNGKEAITEYEILEHRGDKTLIALYPLTGRTHQLRVHCAHPLGLNSPIVGDPLYGHSTDSRMMLHAASITFVHPYTNKEINVETTAPEFSE